MKDYIRMEEYFCRECASWCDSLKYECTKCFKTLCGDCAEEHDCEAP